MKNLIPAHFKKMVLNISFRVKENPALYIYHIKYINYILDILFSVMIHLISFNLSFQLTENNCVFSLVWWAIWSRAGMAPPCKASHTAPYGVLLHVRGAWMPTHLDGCRYAVLPVYLMTPSRMVHWEDFLKNGKGICAGFPFLFQFWFQENGFKKKQGLIIEFWQVQMIWRRFRSGVFLPTRQIFRPNCFPGAGGYRSRVFNRPKWGGR